MITTYEADGGWQVGYFRGAAEHWIHAYRGAYQVDEGAERVTWRPPYTHLPFCVCSFLFIPLQTKGNEKSHTSRRRFRPLQALRMRDKAARKNNTAQRQQKGGSGEGIGLEFALASVSVAFGRTQSFSFLVHNNWEAGASERHSRAENGEQGRKINNLFSILSSPFSARPSTTLTPVLRVVVHLVRSSLSITKRKERDCVQTRLSTDSVVGREMPRTWRDEVNCMDHQVWERTGKDYDQGKPEYADRPKTIALYRARERPRFICSRQICSSNGRIPPTLTSSLDRDTPFKVAFPLQQRRKINSE